MKLNPTSIKTVSGTTKENTFWDDLVGYLLTYPCEPRPWVNKVVAIAHNAKAYDLHFIRKRAIFK
jgi:hypothetical protein